MRILMILVALLVMSTGAGVAIANFAVYGRVTGGYEGLTMPHAALQPYSTLCSSCGGASDAIGRSAEPAYTSEGS